MTFNLGRFSRYFVSFSFISLLSSGSAFSQTITHQINLPAGDSWCSDAMINGLFSTINTFRAQNGASALAMDPVGMKDAEIRATQFAAYMAVNTPNTPGFNPHQGWDTVAAGLGYNIVSENLAYMTTDPNYIVYSVWQDTLHLNAMLANANITGVSCVFSGGIPFWTYEPGCRSTGCSGGGSAPPPPQSPSTTGTPTLDSEEWAFVTLINNFRAQNGVGPLQVSVALSNSSAWMSNDMATKDYFSHTDSLGRNPGTRFADFNYPYTPWGENIAAGNSDAQNTFNQWLNACDADASGTCTYAHRKNMLYSGFVVMGIARAFSANATYGWYWTNDFGGVVDQVISPGSGSGSGSGSGAAPSLSIHKSHSGSFTQGQQHASYSITVSNASTAGATSGTVTVAEALPSGLTLVSMAGTGWSCQGAQCSRSDALTAGASYPSIAVTVNVSATASSPQVNSASVSGGGSASANTSDSTVINATSTSPGPPTAFSVTPSSGTGATQQFTFVWSDPAGFADIPAAAVLFNTGLSGPSACFFIVDSVNRNFLFAADNGSSWTTLPIGSASSLQNSQCVLNGSGSSLTGSGNTLTLRVTINFKTAFAGSKSIFLWVENAAGTTSWKNMGGWTVPGSAPAPSNPGPTSVSVTPSSGTGLTQQFSFLWSDPNGFSDIRAVAALFNTSLSGQGSCFLIVDTASRNILFAADNGSSFSVLPVGASGILQNSQCSLNVAGSTLSGSGNTLTLNVTLTFKAAFAGAKSVFVWVENAAGTANWQTLGRWTVP